MIELSNLSPHELLKKSNSNILLTEEIAIQKCDSDYFNEKCVIVPSTLVDNCKYSTKLNCLIVYMIMRHNTTNTHYIISGNNIRQMDKGLRKMSGVNA